jgi:hypothetical protein
MKQLIRRVQVKLMFVGLEYLKLVVPRAQRLTITIDPEEDPEFSWLIDKPKDGGYADEVEAAEGLSKLNQHCRANQG